MKAIVICAVVGILASAAAGPVVDDAKGSINSVHNEISPEDSILKKLNTKCVNSDISACMMLKLVTYFNRLMKKHTIEFGDVEVTQTSTEAVVVETSRSLENLSDEEQLYELLASKAYNFLKTRSLKWKAVDGADVVISGRSDQDGGLNLGFSLKPTKTEGDARKKKDHHMGALMAAVFMKIGLLKALAFKALVLLVGKALLVSKLALVLAAIIGLKKLLHTEKHVTYEVVAHPHHEHHEHHTSSGHESGWGRNFEAQKLAFNGQIPQK